MVIHHLKKKRIVVGVTGSIAAYKAADLIRRLRDAGAEVRVVMTAAALHFITPLTMQAVSGQPVHTDMLDPAAEAAMGHIELARWADVILIAPASADIMARIATGQANDLLTTLCLATNAPLLIAPAMNQAMWHHTATQANVVTLQARNVRFVGPDTGSQACGDVGLGRFAATDVMIEAVSACFSTRALADVRVLITAGPTCEYIDPVRFISNGSSGKMGYALAAACIEAGAEVTLVSGPTALARPDHVKHIDVLSALEMEKAVIENVESCDIFIAVAAVSDYRPETTHTQKLHKDAQMLSLHFIRNPDIVATVGQLPRKPFIVGFAAETENLIQNAQAKRVRKKMDMIVANQVNAGQGIGSDFNAVTVLSDHHAVELECANKVQIARTLVTMIATEYQQQTNRSHHDHPILT